MHETQVPGYSIIFLPAYHRCDRGKCYSPVERKQPKHGKGVRSIGQSILEAFITIQVICYIPLLLLFSISGVYDSLCHNADFLLNKNGTII
jgi:hypothetical protein